MFLLAYKQREWRGLIYLYIRPISQDINGFVESNITVYMCEI